MTTNETKTPNRRKILLIGGAVATLFSIYLLAFLLPDVLRTVGGPESMTLADAAEIAGDETSYVAIEDGRWNCDSIDYVIGVSATNTRRTTTRFTEVFLTSDDRSIALLASLSGEVTCEELEAMELEGYLTRMSAERRLELTNEARLARFFEADTFLEICGYCGQTNSLIGTMFGIVFAIGGLVMVVLGLRMPASEG